METVNKPKRTLVGEVISDKMDKTIVVKVERGFIHPRVKKYLKTYRKYKVHDEDGKANVGDMVEIYEGRPVSKTKFMYLHRIITPSAGTEQEQR
ncbi:30S ribosomal protein S17 [Candidatus Dependentiae bacterium]|nr:30S ribosomal protein S17 [Candidatus Dependentiae bacterium]